MRTPPPPPFVRDPGTWASYLLLGYFSFVLSTFGGVLPSLRLELGLSFSGASQHSSLFALGLLLASLGGERLARRFGAAWPLWGGALGMAVGVALVLGARSVLWSLTGFFLMGLLGALTLIQVSAELSANHGPNRTRALSEANVLASFCAVLAPLTISGATALGLGWRVGMATAPLFLLLVLARFWRVPFARPQRGPAGRPTPLPPRYWRFWTTVLLCVAAEFGVIFWAVEFLGGGATGRAAAPLGLSGFFLAMLLGRTLGTRLAGRLEAQVVVLASLGLALGGFLAYWLGAWAWLQLAGLFVTGLGIANLYPFVVSLALGAVAGPLEAASARISLASGLAILVAPFMLGALADLTTLRSAQALLPLLLLGALANVAWAFRRPSPEAPLVSQR